MASDDPGQKDGGLGCHGRKNTGARNQERPSVP